MLHKTFQTNRLRKFHLKKDHYWGVKLLSGGEGGMLEKSQEEGARFSSDLFPYQ